MPTDDSEAAATVPTERIEGFTLIRKLGRSGSLISYLGADDETAAAILATVTNVATVDAALIEACRYGPRLVGHPGAVRLIASGVTRRRRPFIVTDVREGGTLRAHLSVQRRLTIDDALLIGRSMADALAAAHADRMAHGHVTPDSIQLDRFGRPALAMFGVATLLTQTARPGDIVRVLGIDHTAPELLSGSPISQASDVYSLASTLYSCVAGRAPFKRSGHTSHEQFARKLAEEAPALTIPGAAKGKPVPDGFADFADLLAAALARSPELRPSAADLLAGLTVIGSGTDTLWPRHQAPAPALQMEVDRHLTAGSAYAAPRPSRSAEAVARLSGPVVRPIPLDRDDGPRTHRRDRDLVVNALTVDPDRARRRRIGLWVAIGATAAMLTGLALSRPGPPPPSGALLPSGDPFATDTVQSRAGELPVESGEAAPPTMPLPSTTPGDLPRVIAVGAAVLDPSGQPITIVPAVTAGTAVIVATSIRPPLAVAPATTRPSSTPVVTTRPPTTVVRSDPTTLPVTATNPPTVAPTVAPTPAPTSPPTAATTIPPPATPPLPTTAPPATAPPTTVDPRRPAINAVSVSVHGDTSVSVSGDGELCAAWGWSVQSDDGTVSIGTGLRYPNGNCFRSPPGYSTGALAPGGYTVTLRLKSTSNGRENSTTKRFTI